MPYAEVFEAFPPELRLAVARLVDALKAEFDVKRADFDELQGTVQELAAAQARTETHLEELAVAQARTEVRLDRLTGAVKELAQAQKRTQDELTLFRRTFQSQVGGLEARWGLQTEEAFRHGIRTILKEVGFTIERFLTWDASGEVFGHPEQVELDVIVQNGKVIVKVVVAPYADERAREVTLRLGIEVCTDVAEFK
jgi:hypothetical protein